MCPAVALAAGQVVGLLMVLTVSPALLVSLHRPVGASRAALLSTFILGAVLCALPRLLAPQVG